MQLETQIHLFPRIFSNHVPFLNLLLVLFSPHSTLGVYALGKESLLHELAMTFKTWVEVSFEKMETLKALEQPDVFTTVPGAGRIRAVEQSQISAAALQQWNEEHPTLVILPTSRPFISFHPNVHVVPYSDHSSYQELEDFVSALKPSSILPIVGDFLPGSLSALLPHKKRPEILVPESVRHYMLRQPESQLSSSAFPGLYRRHFRPLTPKGVLFDSPAKGSVTPCEEVWEADSEGQDGSEENMETDCRERVSECILVDPSVKLTPNKSRGGAGDEWNLDILKLVSATRKKVKAKRVNSRHREDEHVDNSQTVSDHDAMSEHSQSDLNSSVSASCAPYSRSEVFRSEFIERLENSLLEDLPFSQEDLKPRGLLSKSFIRQFTNVP